MERFNEKYKNANNDAFMRKGYGRIFVRQEDDIQKLKDLIKELDDYEYSYLPDDLITVFDFENLESTYLHKFCDMNMQMLKIECFRRNIDIIVWHGLITGYEKL